MKPSPPIAAFVESGANKENNKIEPTMDQVFVSSPVLGGNLKFTRNLKTHSLVPQTKIPKDYHVFQSSPLFHDLHQRSTSPVCHSLFFKKAFPFLLYTYFIFISFSYILPLLFNLLLLLNNIMPIRNIDSIFCIKTLKHCSKNWCGFTRTLAIFIVSFCISNIKSRSTFARQR